MSTPDKIQFNTCMKGKHMAIKSIATASIVNSDRRFVETEEGVFELVNERRGYVATASNADIACFDILEDAIEYLTPSTEWQPEDPVIYETTIYSFE